MERETKARNRKHRVASHSTHNGSNHPVCTESNHPSIDDWKDYERYLDRRSLRTDTQIIIGLFVGMLIVNLIMGVALAWSK